MLATNSGNCLFVNGFSFQRSACFVWHKLCAGTHASSVVSVLGCACLPACLPACASCFPDFAAQTDAQRKKRTFKKFSFRGKDLEGLLQLSPEETMDLLCARARRKFRRGTSAAEVRYMKKLRKAKAAAVEVDGILEKPATVKTHMRNMTIVPEMVGCVCGVYSGKHYVTVEVKVR